MPVRSRRVRTGNGLKAISALGVAVVDDHPGKIFFVVDHHADRNIAAPGGRGATCRGHARLSELTAAMRVLTHAETPPELAVA
jgi:hypothetical protein